MNLIRWHAGMDGDGLDPASVSGATASGGGVNVAVADFIDAVQRLNTELNGPTPSETVRDTDVALPSSLAYAIAEIARLLRDGGHGDEAWAVDTAWLAVLAGDIDDVPKHVSLERNARG